MSSAAAEHFVGIEQFEAGLWKIADDLRANSGLASNEYSMPIMGLLFLRHASNRYYTALAAIEADKAAGTLTLKVLHPKRGIEAIEAIGIIPRYGGVLVHDCWASYFSYDQCAHSLCGVHLLRELACVIEAHDHVWARRMHKLLLEYCHKVAKLEKKALSEKQYEALRKQYRTILTQGIGELPPVVPRKKGQRGRVAKPDVNNLHERLRTHEDAVLRFASDPHTPFKNDLAERGLRMAKVKQKVSGCFRTTTSAQAYCRISSYLQTMAAHGYSPLAAIEIARKGHAAAMPNDAN